MSTIAILVSGTVALHYASFAPPAPSQVKQPILKCMDRNSLIAQKYGGSDPHGDDPHGDDPHDEQHDSKLPANDHRGDGKAPKDVYGGKYPNGQAPY